MLMPEPICTTFGRLEVVGNKDENVMRMDWLK